MDPVSLTSLGLQTLQLALQSGVALHQFVRETRNVNATVRELAHEIRSLQNACKAVHQQLGALAGEYELGGEERAPVSGSIQKELQSCQRTLNALQGSLVDVRGHTANFVRAGWRQFKLNLKQEEIVAMKGRVQSHTAALQVCLLVMDINISHLAPKRVGDELKRKLDGLGDEMRRLERLLREHCEKVDLLVDRQGTVTLSMEDFGGPASELDAVSSCASAELAEVQSSDSDLEERGARSLLACAQDTFSRATSLYEESLYEPSIASRALSRVTASSTRWGRGQSSVSRQAPPGDIREGNGSKEKVTIDIPLNLPSTLTQSFLSLQEHLRDANRTATTSTASKISSGVPARAELRIDKPRRIESVSQDVRRVSVTKHSLAAQDALHSSSGRWPLECLEKYRKTSPSSLSYLEHIEDDLRSFDAQTLIDSRSDVLAELFSSGPAPLRQSRAALTGKLGIGKTYVAAGVVQLTMRKSPKTPIFWVSAAELEHDCRCITERLGLQPPSDGTTPWEWLCKILRRLSGSVIGPWLLVIDGVSVCVGEHEIEKLGSIDTGALGCVLVTTRSRTHAATFAQAGQVLEITSLDPVYAANLLGQDSVSPVSGAFDAVAFFLDFEPYAIVNVRRFLRETGMEIDAFAAQLNVLVDEASWHEHGAVKETARLLSRKSTLKPISEEQKWEGSSLLPVARCCLHPLWPMVFEELQQRHAAASGLLGVLAALGRRDVPRDVVLGDDARGSAAMILIDQGLLLQERDTLRTNRTMLLAHRVWLLDRDALPAAYGHALRLVACEYPEEFEDPEWNRCRIFEPLAAAITSPTAESWMVESNTTRWLKSMLLQKRSRFFRDSGTNKWEADELQAAEVTELRLIHGMRDGAKG